MRNWREEGQSELDRYIIRVQKSTRTLLPFMQRAHEWLRLRYSWYYRWHTNPINRWVHFTVLAVNLLVVGAFFASSLGLFNSNKVPRTHAADCPGGSGDIIVNSNTAWPEGNYACNSLTVNSGANLTIAGNAIVTLAGQLSITGNSKITAQGKTAANAGVSFHVGSMQIDSGSSIDANGQGFGAALGTGAGVNAAGGGSHNGGGGAYGGNGGFGSVAGGTAHGSITTPTSLGSGGGNAYDAGCALSGGGTGGGAIILTVDNNATINGTITANGVDGTTTSCGGSRGGGGSGGTISITVNGAVLGTTGLITANGGGVGNYGGGGGGGRIALTYGTDSYTGGISTLTSVAKTQARGGSCTQFCTWGGAGSVYVKQVSSANGKLRYDNNNAAASAPSYIESTAADFGAITFGDITISGAAQPSIAGGITLNSNGTLTLANDANTILYTRSTNTSLDSSGVGVTLNVASLAVNTLAAIKADGSGYAAAHGNGKGGASSGGGHGGAGGGASGGAAYDVAYSPVIPGSGGAGAAGGGAVKITTTGNMAIDGLISANGYDSASGAGAGGAIWLASSGAVNMTNGTIRANGGAGTTAGGGGGGRVAINYNTRTWSGQTITANAGTGGGTAAGAGTVYTTPVAPTMNEPGSVTTSSITWSLTDNSDNEKSFKIYNAEDDSLLQTISSTTEATTGTVYTWDENVAPGGRYRRYAKAFDSDSGIYSNASNIITKYAQTNVPNNQSLETVSASSQTVQFGNNSNDAIVTYAIYDNSTSKFVQADGSEGDSAAWRTFAQWGNGTATVTGLLPNTSHNYKIQAKNGDGATSDWSGNTNAVYTNANTPGNLTVSAPKNIATDSLYYINSTSILIKVQSNSNPGTTQYVISVTRTAPAPADSEKFVGTPSGGEATLGDSEVWLTYAQWNGATGITLTGLAENNTYSVKVKARNAVNIETSYCATSTVTTPIAPTAPGTLDIIDGSDANLDHYRLVLDWTGIDNLSLDYYIIERSTNGTDYAQLDTTANLYYADNSVSAGTNYYYRVKAHTNVPDTSAASPVVSGVPGTGPEISSINAESSEASLALVGWNTNINADSIVEYGLTTSYGSTAGNLADLSTSHSVTLSGLSAETTYHYRIRSRGATGPVTLSEDKTFITAPAIIPIITAISSGTPGITTATITWTTDLLADSYVEFGASASYGSLQGSSTLTTNHSVTIVGLSMFTGYHYRVRSKGAVGNMATSDDYILTTGLSEDASLALEISNVVSNITEANKTKAVITWDTNKTATTQVRYGITSTLGQVIEGNATATLNHYAYIPNLTAETTYYYQVRSVDASGSEKLSELKTFATPASATSQAAAISAVTVTDITLTSAIVSWKTSTITSSLISLGTSTAYGQTVGDLSAGSTTVHTVRLSNLEQGMEYHFRIKGTSASGGEIASDDYVFSTQTMPNISSIIVKNISATSATVTWKTNVPTDSFVDFGLNSSNLDQSQGRSEEVLDHAVTLIGLNQATIYSFKVKSRDVYTNLAITDASSFQTTVDVNPPVIKDLKSETAVLTDTNGESKAQAIISWSTDEPSTAQVQYTLGVANQGTYQNSTPEDISMATSHIAVISNLLPSATYHLRVISKDAAGNIAVSDDYTVLTLKQETTLLQYIVQILEERFFWVKGLGVFGE